MIFWEDFLLPPANEVCEGYVFTGVCLSTPEGGVCVWLLLGGACMVAPGGGHAWLLPGGACVVAPGGGACMVAKGGQHVWLLWGGHAWDMMRYGDTINERAVRILLECILVWAMYFHIS